MEVQINFAQQKQVNSPKIMSIFVIGSLHVSYRQTNVRSDISAEQVQIKTKIPCNAHCLVTGFLASLSFAPFSTHKTVMKVYEINRYFKLAPGW